MWERAREGGTLRVGLEMITAWKEIWREKTKDGGKNFDKIGRGGCDCELVLCGV